MKKLLVIAIAIGFMACTKPAEKPTVMCELAKVGVNLISGQVAKRWTCDSAKVEAFLLKPVNDKLCAAQKSAIVGAVCPMVIGFVVDLGADKIASEFSCDLAKVKADLAQADKLCDLLSK